MAWKVIQVILERRLEMCDQPMDTVRPRCTRVKPGKGVHSGNYYKSAHTTAYEASGSSGTACELIKTRKILSVRY